MNKYFFLLASSLLLSISSQPFAQAPLTARPGPPKVLLIVQADIKPGMMGTHNRHSAEFASILRKLQIPNHRLSLVPVAGNENEILYLTGGDSFAELESIQQATDKKTSDLGDSIKADLDRLNKEAPLLYAAARVMLAVLRRDLSYNPDVNLPTMRYMTINTVRVRPGQEEQFVQYVRSLNATRDSVRAELHVVAFQVVAGSESVTYMFFRPMKSLVEYDLRIGPRVREAMSDDQKEKSDKLAGEAIMFSETSIYAFNPQMSYVSKELAAGDPSFWNPKPKMVGKPKRQAAKPIRVPNPLLAAAANLPQFPWPPPIASSQAEVPRRMLANASGLIHLREVCDTLTRALSKAGYMGISLFSVPGGFALVSQLEQFREDGSPLAANERWSLRLAKPPPGSPLEYLRTLFTAQQGHYRVIVFVVSPFPFMQVNKSLTREEAGTWLSQGLNQLPPEIGEMEFSSDYKCSTLIYEFEQATPDHPAVFKYPSKLNGREHLQRAGIWDGIDREK